MLHVPAWAVSYIIATRSAAGTLPFSLLCLSLLSFLFRTSLFPLPVKSSFLFWTAFLFLQNKLLFSFRQLSFLFRISPYPLPYSLSFSSTQASFLFRSSLLFSSGRAFLFLLAGQVPFLFRTAFLFLPNKSLSSSGQVSLSLQDGPFLPLPGRKTSESDGPLRFEPYAASPNPSASFCHAALLSHLRTESPCSATGSNADRSCGDSSPAVRSPGISACRRGMPVPEHAHRRKDVASRVRAIPQCRDNRPPEPGP